MNETAVMNSTARRTKKPFYRALYFHVLVAIVLGVLLGHFDPSLAIKMKPLGDAFIKLIDGDTIKNNVHHLLQYKRY